MTSIVELGSSEEVALFNPAYISRILNSAVTDYEKAIDRAMPVELAFLAVPLVLHKPTRDNLPTNASSQMHAWIREHPRQVAGVDKRVVGMRPFVGMGIRFGLLHGVLTSSGRRIGAGAVKRRPRGHVELESAEVQTCLRMAAFLGRWFARQPDDATVLALWGLRP